MLTQQYEIDMIPSGVPLTLHISQGDVGLTQFKFTPYVSVGEMDLSSVRTAYIEATKPDGLALSHACTYSGGVATYTVQKQLAVVAGRVWSKLVLKDASNNVVASKAIVWMVDRAGINDDSTVSDSQISQIQQAISAGTSAANSAQQAADTLATIRSEAATIIDSVDSAVADAVSQMQVKEGQTVIDKTLTVDGAAAESKTTGDAIVSLRNDVYDGMTESASASGEIIEIDDAAGGAPAEALVLNLEPHQDLHGYDHPWIGGSGKNLLIVGNFEHGVNISNGSSVTCILNDDGTFTINGTVEDAKIILWNISNPDAKTQITQASKLRLLENGTYTASVTQGTPGIYLQVRYGDDVTVDKGSIMTSIYDGEITFTVTDTHKYNWARIQVSAGTYNNVKFKPMIRLATETDATFEPYENICPITGYDVVNVMKVGENLLPNVQARTATFSGVTFTSDGKGAFSIKGTATAANYMAVAFEEPFTIPDGQTHALLLRNSDANANAYIRFALNDTVVDSWSFSVKDRIANGYGGMSNKQVNRIHIGVSQSGEYDITFAPIFVPKTEFETLPISLASAGTVYGGTLDVKSGKLTADRVCIDLASLSHRFAVETTSGRPILVFGIPGRRFSSSEIGLSSHYKFIGNGNSTQLNNKLVDGSFGFQPTLSNARFYNSACSTVEEYQEALSGVQLAYTLAEPQTYTLTPHEIYLLTNHNTLYMDADGTIDLTYKTSPQSKIAKLKAMIAPVENGTASRNYAKGAFLIVGETLYKASVAITSGTTITPGTNVVATTIAEQLMALA